METAPAAPARGPHDYHPLEVIPFFQRFRPSRWRDLLYTFIWNTGLGLAFWLVALAFVGTRSAMHLLVWNVMMANIIGYSIHGLFVVGHGIGLERAARDAGKTAITVYYTGVSTIGVIGGYLLMAYFLNEPVQRYVANPRWIGVIAFSCLLISAILATIFFARERSAVAEAALERERTRAERVEREAARAELRALQAQIEPHFLFNTLANVASLIDTNPALARRTVESFNRFLRGSLAATRSETTTLGEEAKLIAAFLDVLQVRMGARLRYAVDVPDSLSGVAIAPMLLQPVVENAIKHGLEPRVDGGEVRMSARGEAGQVVVEIADTGAGFAPTTRGGVGLTNIRGRLKLLYGERAGLDVADNPGGGTLVRVRLPR